MNTQLLATIQERIEAMLGLMDMTAMVTLELDESDVVQVDIQGDNMGILIGYHGETLQALQTIIGLMIHREAKLPEGERQKVVVNIGDYRQRQREALQALARRSAERVRFTRKPLTLPPMSSYDRRLVHLYLEQEVDVMSESEGEGRERRLVVKLRET